jgi:antitoxin HicB
MTTEKIKRIANIKPPHPFEAYAHIISPLSFDSGGGFLLTIPDLPGCMSDGETEEEALQNGRDAFHAMASALADMGREIPPPSFSADAISAANASGKFVTRVPKSLHAQLAARAKAEGVSLNTLAVSFLAAGIGH